MTRRKRNVKWEKLDKIMSSDVAVCDQNVRIAVLSEREDKETELKKTFNACLRDLSHR